MFFIGTLVFVALLSSCSLGNSPKAAVQKFQKAIEKNDMKALAQVATPETVQLIAAFGSKIQGYAASMSTKKVKKITEEIDGNTAVVTYIFADGEEEDFNLVKIDGKWKVDIGMDFSSK
jgi:ketosteroid isomerase-like protein